MLKNLRIRNAGTIEELKITIGRVSIVNKMTGPQVSFIQKFHMYILEKHFMNSQVLLWRHAHAHIITFLDLREEDNLYNYIL